MKLGLLALLALFSLAAVVAQAAPVDEDYALFLMTNGAVIQTKSGEKGEVVRLLKNPKTATIGTETVPMVPANPVWAPVPDSSYRTMRGTTFVIHDSKIVNIISVGTDVSDP